MGKINIDQLGIARWLSLQPQGDSGATFDQKLATAVSAANKKQLVGRALKLHVADVGAAVGAPPPLLSCLCCVDEDARPSCVLVLALTGPENQKSGYPPDIRISGGYPVDIRRISGGGISNFPAQFVLTAAHCVWKNEQADNFTCTNPRDCRRDRHRYLTM